MNNVSVGLLISGVLVGLGGLMPANGVVSPNRPILLAQADIPPLPLEPTIPIPPLPQEPAPAAPDNLIGVDPTRAGMIRVETGTQLVSFLRPIGVADSCQWTTCNAPAGSQWLGKDERIYVKLADGSFRIQPTARERAAGVQLVDARPAMQFAAANT